MSSVCALASTKFDSQMQLLTVKYHQMRPGLRYDDACKFGAQRK